MRPSLMSRIISSNPSLSKFVPVLETSIYSRSTTISSAPSTNFFKSSIWFSMVPRSLFAPLSRERRAYSPALNTGFSSFTAAVSAAFPILTKSAFLDFLAISHDLPFLNFYSSIFLCIYRTSGRLYLTERRLEAVLEIEVDLNMVLVIYPYPVDQLHCRHPA